MRLRYGGLVALAGCLVLAGCGAMAQGSPAEVSAAPVVSSALPTPEFSASSEIAGASSLAADASASAEMVENKLSPGVDYWVSEGECTGLDLDRDGFMDILSICRAADEISLVYKLTLGNGQTYEADSHCTRFERFDVCDLTGDGKQELVLLADTGGCGGAGCHGVMVLSVGETAVEQLPLPSRGEENSFWETGYGFATVYKDGFLMDIFSETGLVAADVAIPQNRANMMVESGYVNKADGTSEKSDTHGLSADGIYSYEVVELDRKVCLKVCQYIWDFGHSDSVGDGTSWLCWENGAFRLVKQAFAVYP